MERFHGVGTWESQGRGCGRVKMEGGLQGAVAKLLDQPLRVDVNRVILSRLCQFPQPEDGVISCVPLCLWSLRPWKSVNFLVLSLLKMTNMLVRLSKVISWSNKIN